MNLPIKTKNFIIETIKKALKKESLYQIILFGSYAKGEEHENSDIDIAIQTPNPLDPALWSLIKESFEESNIIQEVDVIDYQRVHASFKKKIDEQGIVLYAKNEDISATK